MLKASRTAAEPAHAGLAGGALASGRQSAPRPAPAPSAGAEHPLAEIAQWRAERRRQARAAHLSLSDKWLTNAADQIARHLGKLIERVASGAGPRPVVGWIPRSGEPDLRAWMTALVRDGTPVMVPVAVKGQPRFHFVPWPPGATAIRVAGQEAGQSFPAVVLAPFLGWDNHGYRLGRGSGVYDRTLSRLPPDTTIIGVGLELARLDGICPQPFDVSMDAIVTEAGVRFCAPGRI